MSKKVAIVGTGLIGRSWSIVFVRAGFEVWLWDPVDGAVSTAIDLIKEGLPSLAEENLLNGCPVEQVFGRVHASNSLEDALDGADKSQLAVHKRTQNSHKHKHKSTLTSASTHAQAHHTSLASRGQLRKHNADARRGAFYPLEWPRSLSPTRVIYLAFASPEASTMELRA